MPDATWIGRAARVWRAPLSDDRRKRRAALAMYLLDAPGAHPFWRFHALMVIHLRPEKGIPEPKLHFPGATHEFGVFALDPADDAGIDAGDIATWHYLMPPDAVVQVILPSDEAAVAVGELAAVAVAEGTLVPDSDHRRAWDAMLQRTAEHVRLGGHPDG